MVPRDPDALPALLLPLTRDERATIERAHQEAATNGRTLDEWARDVLLSSLPRFPISLTDRVKEIERAAIEAALIVTGANQVRAAELLGISRRGLIAKLEKLGLKAKPSRRGTRRRRRGKFTATFQRAALRKVDAGQSIDAVARELEVPEALLRGWVRAAR
jgi:hypothetical protein